MSCFKISLKNFLSFVYEEVCIVIVYFLCSINFNFRSPARLDRVKGGRERPISYFKEFYLVLFGIHKASGILFQLICLT